MLKYHKVHGVLTCAHILNEVISPDQICLICLRAYIGLHRLTSLLNASHIWKASGGFIHCTASRAAGRQHL